MPVAPALAPLHDEVAKTSTVVASAVTLLGSLHDRLVAALTGGDMEADVKALANDLSTSRNALAEAVAANTIADPAPVDAANETHGAAVLDENGGIPQAGQEEVGNDDPAPVDPAPTGGEAAGGTIPPAPTE